MHGNAAQVFAAAILEVISPQGTESAAFTVPSLLLHLSTANIRESCPSVLQCMRRCSVACLAGSMLQLLSASPPGSSPTAGIHHSLLRCWLLRAQELLLGCEVVLGRLTPNKDKDDGIDSGHSSGEANPAGVAELYRTAALYCNVCLYTSLDSQPWHTMFTASASATSIARTTSTSILSPYPPNGFSSPSAECLSGLQVLPTTPVQALLLVQERAAAMYSLGLAAFE